MSESSPVLGPVADYYSHRAREHGARPEGVDWNSPEAQEHRWAQFLSLFNPGEKFSLLDYGCGYGGFHTYIQQHGFDHQYLGYDISADQVGGASRLHASDPACSFVTDLAGLEPVDYVVGSGIFNVKLDASIEAWETSIRSTLATMAGLSRKGFGFNMLTRHSDPERRREHLYYGDPADYVRYCLETFSRHLVLKHDYGLYDFTILVRLED
jgi:SAM-dependent methyltransferase